MMNSMPNTIIKIEKNPDAEIFEYGMQALKENQGYCPCSLIKTAETKCMCKDFRDKVKQGYVGECNCGLYVAVALTKE